MSSNKQHASTPETESPLSSSTLVGNKEREIYAEDYPGCVIKMHGGHTIEKVFSKNKEISCLEYVCSKSDGHKVSKIDSVPVEDEKKVKKCPVCRRPGPARYVVKCARMDNGEAGWLFSKEKLKYLELESI
ncbi:hypothetical protein GLAREA_02249 [Glarea lozoyensis ATCC 20868]|uniref:Uncharacterized protein n=1 Tax=Glarea lozoyensis (strain ATCC 20868 / MF5171) TaxID=1116229 RepID=S3CIM9_GLAL2|nr:uncharacterized protein GLAREA_02249 [Glarea lozoyensis ATCC 20868]EPE26337.1 hypothetical protein GLAREA_02249 [Glarea lozoyensis ATCC 20868]